MLWLQHERLSSLLTLSGPSERHGQCKSLEAPLVSTVHQKKETAQVWVRWVVFKRETSTWVSIGCQANHAISPWDISRWILTFRQLLQLILVQKIWHRSLTSSDIKSGRGFHTFNFESRSPSRAMNCATWEPNPPIEPSSTVINTWWFLASWRIRLWSRGLQNRASATVTDTPQLVKIVWAARHCCTIDP